MKLQVGFLLFLIILSIPAGRAIGGEGDRALGRSDVVFMYQADRATYEGYGATVLAWGGRPTPEALAEAGDVRFFGSVGMVTEFRRFYERFPERYEAALCRDLEGNPIKIPWLTDHSHKGIPYWWCCTSQPLFQIYLKERVADTLRSGADGLHIDDHMGSAATLWHGGCFCDRCVDGFQTHLAGLSPIDRERLDVEAPEDFDYRNALQSWKGMSANRDRPINQHPLWDEWVVYHCRRAAAFMTELRQVAEDVAGGPMPIGANAGLLWPRHLSDYQVLDLFSAETEHHAANRTFYDGPIFAYRLADAVGRPYAATASGPDWAFVKEHGLDGLVRGWVALSYASGQALMAPHRQWCYTPEKGTHWYDGPEEAYAPLYRFVRSQAPWLDGHVDRPDIGVVVPHASFLKDGAGWIETTSALSRAHCSYRILLAGDRIVDHPLTEEDWDACPAWLVLGLEDFLPKDRAFVEAHLGRPGVYRSLDAALESVQPAVRVKAPAPVRVFPREGPKTTTIHLVNFDYDPAADRIRPQENLEITMDIPRLRKLQSAVARVHRPDGPDLVLKRTGKGLILPELGLWAILILE